METLPREFDLAGGRKVSLRPVGPEDEEFLLRVYASTREDELAQVPWSEEQKAAFVRQQSDAQRREYNAHYPAAEYDVILLDGAPAGRVWIGRDEEEIHLLDIALLREAQNCGVGTALLRALIEESRASGKRLRHMVFVMNTDALRFYERLGFLAFEEVGPYLHMEWRGELGGGATSGDPCC
jgi:ribosomal protein S18 acetylase RimI-like enzyme